MTKPVRVLHVMDTLEGGGSQRWLWEIVRGAQPDVEHRVITAYSDGGNYVWAARLREAGLYQQPPATGLLAALDRRLHGRAALGPGLPRKAIGALWLLQSFLTGARTTWHAVRTFRPTVIHAHGYLGYVLGVGAAVLSRRPVVHTVPALTAQMIETRSAWLPWLYGRTHRAVRRYFTSMPSEQRAVGIPAAKLYMIPGAIDLAATEAARSDRASLRARVLRSFGIPAGSRVLLHVGRMHRSKGQDHAIAAMPALPADVHLILLGHGPTQDEMMRTVRALGLADRVHFAGYQDDPLPFYAAADLYLRISTLEGDNMSSLLAFAMELAVVAFDTGAETDLLPLVGNGVRVPAGATAELTAAIASLLDRPEERAAMAARGLRYAHEELDVRRTIADYHRFYRELSV